MNRFFNTLTEILIVFGVPFLVAYLMAGFPEWDWNIAGWSRDDRWSFLLIWMIMSFVTLLARD